LPQDELVQFYVNTFFMHMISIILPTLNEQENLPLIVALIVDEFHTRIKEEFEIIVVDDNSQDGTRQAFQDLKDVYGDVKMEMILRPGKLGLGTAYRDGLKSVKGEFVVLMDADLSHNPAYISEMMVRKQKASNADVVSGTRYKPGGGVVGWTLTRCIVSAGANVLGQLLTGVPASDFTGSFRLYRKSVLDKVIPQMNCKGYVFQLEAMVLSSRAGFKIVEVPIVFADRVFGETKLGPQEFIEYLKGLVRLIFHL